MPKIRHKSITCRADEASALEYVMTDGTIVLAYSRRDADDAYALEKERAETAQETTLSLL